MYSAAFLKHESKVGQQYIIAKAGLRAQHPCFFNLLRIILGNVLDSTEHFVEE